MPEIKRVSALEILDSRGRPTVKSWCEFASGAMGDASVPSGASTGASEALELRDGDASRYGGLGCKTAVANINGEINDNLAGRIIKSQADLDSLLIALDGTANKARLGANAILGVSLSYSRAAALDLEIPLYKYFAALAGLDSGSQPRLTVNLFSGGKHAGNQVPIQDVLVSPLTTETVNESLAVVYKIYQTAVSEINKRYGMRLLRADEGGLAPPASSIDELLALAVECIELSGYSAGVDVGLAVDVASSHFYLEGIYELGERSLNSSEMVEWLTETTAKYHIVSLEDGLAEEDWDNWSALLNKIGGRCLVLGDDFLCTNPERIKKAGASRAANALLLKVNQIGTVSEALESLHLARKFGWKVTVSARSGETEDNWLADLAYGWRADAIKIGSITQSERLAKYNRLLEIENLETLSES